MIGVRTITGRTAQVLRIATGRTYISTDGIRLVRPALIAGITEDCSTIVYVDKFEIIVVGHPRDIVMYIDVDRTDGESE